MSTRYMEMVDVSVSVDTTALQDRLGEITEHVDALENQDQTIKDKVDEYLDENLGALDISLSAEDLRRLDAIAPRGATAGLRYPEQHMSAVGI